MVGAWDECPKCSVYVSMMIVHGASVAWVGLLGVGVHGMCVYQIGMHVTGVLVVDVLF
jgi:hypothetical protein